jgi:mercuric ion transport protein
VLPRTLLEVGVIGSLVAALWLCCATPVLVILLGLVGLSAWVGGLDYVLIPALGIVIGLSLYTLYAARHPREQAACFAVKGEPGGDLMEGRP